MSLKQWNEPHEPGDIYLNPKDGVYYKVVKFGPVQGVEVMHGYQPPAKKRKRQKASDVAFRPGRQTGFELAPVVEKFLLWRYPPVVRPRPSDLTNRQKDRMIRLAVLDKRTNYYPCTFWDDARRKGMTDADLKLALRHEFQCSTVRNHQDKRRIAVYTRGKGADAPVIVLGEPPDEWALSGEELLIAARRALGIKRLY